jgi:hypothetical protein
MMGHLQGWMLAQTRPAVCFGRKKGSSVRAARIHLGIVGLGLPDEKHGAGAAELAARWCPGTEVLVRRGKQREMDSRARTRGEWPVLRGSPLHYEF